MSHPIYASSCAVSGARRELDMCNSSISGLFTSTALSHSYSPSPATIPFIPAYCFLAAGTFRKTSTLREMYNRE